MTEYIVGDIYNEDGTSNWFCVPSLDDLNNEYQSIVRCRDCKHSWENLEIEYDDAYEAHEIYSLYCTHPAITEPSSLVVNPRGFCAWGEKEE